MTYLTEECQRLLSEAGIASTTAEIDSQKALVFESTTVLGFIIIYDSPSRLLHDWERHTASLIKSYRLSLRRAEQKAWNTYTIFIAQDSATESDLIALSTIEEDLSGTRKIARAGIRDVETLATTLLPLLPIQNSPRLEAVDMKEEIKLRTTELPPRAVEAFLSDATDVSILQVLEEQP